MSTASTPRRSNRGTTTEKVEENMDTPVVEENTNITESDNVEEMTAVVPEDDNTTETPRVPEALADNVILKEFCDRYLEVFDEISKYNEAVLSAKDDEWTPVKVLTKAREFGSPDNAADIKVDVKKALDEFDAAATALSLARKNLLEVTSKELGITLSSTIERNAETEAPLKEKRKLATEIGKNLAMIASMTNDKNAANAVTTFFANFPLPAIGRDQASTFGSDSTSTPKYRVNVVVTKNDEIVVEESGFTKAALALTKPVCGYERGKAPKSDTLRAAWEKEGNTPEKTVTNPVVFEDNGLKFTITKKS